MWTGFFFFFGPLRRIKMFLHILRSLRYCFLGHFATPLASPFDTAITRLYVGFRTMDAFLHVNNARYLEFFEFARWYHGCRSGLVKFMLRTRCYPVLGIAHIHYLAPLGCFRFVDIKTECLGVHGKAFLMQQTIMDTKKSDSKTGQPKVYAIALFKCTFIRKGKPVEVKQVCDLYGIPEAYDRMTATSLGPDVAPPKNPQKENFDPYIILTNSADDEWRRKARLEKELNK